MDDDKSLVPQTPWINTPFAYLKEVVAKKKELTRLEQDILFNVSGSIQRFLEPFYKQERYKSKERPNSLFSPEDLQRLDPIVVRMADYGIDSAHYSDIRRAVDSILNMRILIPMRTDDDSEMRLKWVNVFLEGETTVTDSGYTYTDREGRIQVAMRSNGELKFEINPKVAAYTFDMSMGYIQHPRNIAQLVNANHTPLFYTLLKHACAKGSQCRLTVNAIKEHLGLVERDDQDRVVRYMLPKYSQFRKLVIEKVQRDLERMAAEDKIDITFSFTEVRLRGKKTGDPYYIEFHITKTDYGKLRDSAKHREAATAKLVQTLCSRCGDLDRDRLAELANRVGDDDFADFVSFAYKDAFRIVESNYPEDVASFLMRVLSNWVSSRSDSSTSRLRQPTVLGGSAVDHSLNTTPDSADSSHGSRRVSVEPPSLFDTPDTTDPVPDQFVPGALADQYDQLRQRCDPQYLAWLDRATFMGSLRGRMYIQFPDRATYDAFCDFESDPRNSRLFDEFNQLCRDILGTSIGGIIRGYPQGL